MNKKEFFKHIKKHTERNGIKWAEDFIKNTKVYTAFSKEKELLVFNNKYMLSFNINTKEFIRSNFDNKENNFILTKAEDLNCEEGKELIKTINKKIKKRIYVE